MNTEERKFEGLMAETNIGFLREDLRGLSVDLVSLFFFQPVKGK
jgi:hypothetical protein